MRAGYFVVNLIAKKDKIIVVANLHDANIVQNFGEKSEELAKKQKYEWDIGFWRIKRK